MGPKGISHDYVPFPRPVVGGRPLIRRPTGFFRATPKTAETLSPDVCATCGHALTDIQLQRFERTGSARHSAIPALNFILK